MFVLDPKNPNDLFDRFWAVANAAANAEGHMFAFDHEGETHVALPITEWLPVIQALERLGMCGGSGL